MKTITKKVLIDLISANTKYKKADVGKIMNLVLDSIVIELGKGNRIELRNFGVFESTMRASRKAQNPKTLEPVQVPAKRVVKFKPGKVMKFKVEQSAVGNQGASKTTEMPVVETSTVVTKAKEPVTV
ncbi:MAG TPA: HU family DNA-binding protein [Phycisphaerales bacterium]|nr:HU family DNA-binding protein [Phycisphaerales bacterium]HIB00757.1 HU family DNA-binding protein [Phycisphaerales bacterium]HIN83804.1 HU family DNA-binding protein [Phycisphaerales bacterium]HIO20011.1 HU family DNA-binding protein [Phycisphaerales bacterium]HIO52547.1 HU family DNA-binding protein [Phycisphaerales bacterium]